MRTILSILLMIFAQMAFSQALTEAEYNRLSDLFVNDIPIKAKTTNTFKSLQLKSAAAYKK